MDDATNKLALPIALGIMIGFQCLINNLLFVLTLINNTPGFFWLAAIGMPLFSCITIVTCFIFAHRKKAHIAFPIIASVFGGASLLMAFVLLLIK
ncbi:MAG: hypothetical protein FWD65_08225 [Coriobacteriia bacterium]|nr:hypothetical protein [Coriobacteriia bacterium]